MRLAIVAICVACSTPVPLHRGHDAGSRPGAAPDGHVLGPDASVDDPRFAPLIAALRADLAANEGATAASAAVWIDGEAIWVGGFGSIDPASDRPPGEDTVFMIGSDTKKITAVSLLRRVNEGRVTLDSTIADVLPDLRPTYAPEYTRATIRELLAMEGGIVDGTETSTETTDRALQDFAYGELASTYYSLAPPGVLFNYSNPNFSIAGLIDQRLDGRMWPDIVAQDVFAPLGMTRTFARKSEVDADHAPGYGWSGSPGDTTEGPVSLAETWESGFSRPAGLVWSTPSDQMRLAAFLVDGDAEILSDELRATMTTAQTTTYPDLPGGYGFGLGVDDGITLDDSHYDIRVWSHGGDTTTHSSTFYVLPEQRFAISILSNSGGDDFTRSVHTAIATLVDLPPARPLPAVPFDAAALDGLTGTYIDEFNLGRVLVTRAADALQIELPLLDESGVAYRRALAPVSTRVWTAEIDGQSYDVAFVAGPSGEMYFRNRSFVAIRPTP